MNYIVRRGDTLNSIASRLTIGGKAYAQAIANANNIQNINLIQVGQSLIIPDEWLINSAATGNNPVPFMSFPSEPTSSSVARQSPMPASVQPGKYNPVVIGGGVNEFLKNPWVLGAAALLIILFLNAEENKTKR